MAVIITDGKSQDEVEIPARELRSTGVEVFSLGRLDFIQKLLWGGRIKTGVFCLLWDSHFPCL